MDASDAPRRYHVNMGNRRRRVADGQRGRRNWGKNATESAVVRSGDDTCSFTASNTDGAGRMNGGGRSACQPDGLGGLNTRTAVSRRERELYGFARRSDHGRHERDDSLAFRRQSPG
ncbi:hypothetical protein [Burkholderia seminalis]|uniref:hypothetical protein n=1 Tax=Burkholderia seminalis TaxID=488731 RepID=UPI0026505B93|nr:hypothetical protein [Burkholderia seminalis]MDN7586959.1 hypothetical protein [Burkholderia seminalis]